MKMSCQSVYKQIGSYLLFTTGSTLIATLYNLRYCSTIRSADYHVCGSPSDYCTIIYHIHLLITEDYQNYIIILHRHLLSSIQDCQHRKPQTSTSKHVHTIQIKTVSVISLAFPLDAQITRIYMVDVFNTIQQCYVLRKCCTAQVIIANLKFI